MGRLLYHDNDDSDSDIDCENLINLSKFINKYDADTNRALKIFTLLIATKKGFFDMECFNDVSVKLIPNVLRLAQRFVEGNACLSDAYREQTGEVNGVAFWKHCIPKDNKPLTCVFETLRAWGVSLLFA